jgi:PmbA protein
VGATEIKPLELADESVLSPKQMIEMMGGFVGELRSLDDDLVVGGSLSSEFSEISLETSNGFGHGYRKSAWSYGCSVELMQGDDLLAIYEGKREMGPVFDFAKMKDDIARKLQYAKTVVPFEAGAYPVIFTPGEVGNIINPVIASLNGMAVYRKISPWSDKLGQVLLDEKFTLLDDGAVDKCWTAKPFDLEGTPVRRNVLVEKGRLNDLLTNRKVAAQLGRESSGNAGSMGPMANYLQLEAGSKTLDELIASIDYGLLIDGTMGAWSGNPYAGIVTGTISMGLKIEKGKIVGRVKDCMFTVNAFEHFNKHFAGCTAEREQARIMFGAVGLFPHVLLDEVVISTKN